MQIKKITIHNFRSILDQFFYMNDFSLLVGENNSGKSNVIYAIRAFYGKIKYDKKVDFPKTGVKDNESWIEIEFITNIEEQNDLKLEYKNRDNLLTIRKYLECSNLKPTTTNSNAYVVKDNGELHKEQFYGAKGISQGKMGNIIFIPSVSKIEDTFKMSGVSPFRDVVNFVMSDIVKKSSSFEKLEGSFKDFKDIVKTEKNIDGVSLDDLSKKINKEIANWKEVKFDFGISNITPDLIVKNLIFPELIDNNFGEEINSENFGQGFQRSLIVSLIKIDAELKSTSKKNQNVEEKKEFSPDFTLILFEEPEAFLHFTQEEKLNFDLRKLAKENNKQVLIATHSPYFVGKNIEDISNIIKLKKETEIETEISQIKKDKIKEFNKQNDGLSDMLKTESTFDLESEAMKYFIWLDTERASMFFAKNILICEGATEKIFLDYLFDNEWKNFKKDGLYILDSMGKYNIHRFMNLFEKLEIEHFVLFDYDTGKEIQQKVNKFINKNKNSFTKKIDYFEKDIEYFLNIEVPKNRKDLKPLNILYKYKNEKIEKDHLIKLREKLEELLK